jgi:hypothetical protein
MDFSDAVHHDQVRTMLGAYAIGALADDEGEQVDANLSRCSPCREELPRLLDPAKVLRSGDLDDPPADLWESIRSPHHPT